MVTKQITPLNLGFWLILKMLAEGRGKRFKNQIKERGHGINISSWVIGWF
ncbi:MAG: hypothetical protein RLZZ361_25 [Cyanobacteriota bacterium]|jgi:hypothetical protein